MKIYLGTTLLVNGKNCNSQEQCEMNLEDKIDEDFYIYSGFDVFQMEYCLQHLIDHYSKRQKH